MGFQFFSKLVKGVANKKSLGATGLSRKEIEHQQSTKKNVNKVNFSSFIN